MRFLTLVISILLFCSCSTFRNTEETLVDVNNTQEHIIQKEIQTIYQKDSSYVFVHQEGDTIYNEQIHNHYFYNTLVTHDTITIIDSVYVKQETVKEEVREPWYVKSITLRIVLVCIVVLAFMYLKRR